MLQPSGTVINGDFLNYFRIIKFALVLLFVETVLSTVTTLLIGSDNLIHLSFYENLTYQYIPSSITVLVIFIMLARRQADKPLVHALLVYLVCEFIGFLILSALMNEFYYPSTWVIYLPLSLLSLIVGTFIGVRLRTDISVETYIVNSKDS